MPTSKPSAPRLTDRPAILRATIRINVHEDQSQTTDVFVSEGETQIAIPCVDKAGADALLAALDRNGVEINTGTLFNFY